MEVEVFGGLEEILTGKEKERFDSFLNINKVGVLENTVSDQTNANNNVVSSKLHEQATSGLDEDLDEVMQNFKKKNQEGEQISNEINDLDEYLTIEALLELEQSVVLDADDDDVEQEKEEMTYPPQGSESGRYMKWVDHYSIRGDKHVGDHFERYGPINNGGLLSLGSNYSRYQYYNQYLSWNEANMNSVFGRLTDHYSPCSSSGNLSTPRGVVGRSSIVPSLSSSSSSSSYGGDYNRPKILLGGLIDISFLNKPTPPSSNEILHGGYHSSLPSWNNLHGVTLGHSSSSSYSSSYAPWNNDRPQGESFYGSSGCGVYLSQCSQEGNGGVVDLSHSQPKSRVESFMSRYNKIRNTLSKVSNCIKVAPKKIRKKREVQVELPPGWEVVGRPRKNGKSKGQVDKYYINKEMNQRCRSLSEVYRYLDIAKTNNHLN